MKYIIYLRVSTKDQQDVRTQLQMCLHYIKQKDPDPFEHVVFTDKITSRKPLTKRPGIMAALNAVDQGDILIAVRMDRIARKAAEAHIVKDRLIEKKAGLFMVDQPSINNPLVFSIHVGMAEEEAEVIRARVRNKLKAKRDRGERTNYNIPYGYRLNMDPESYVPIIRHKKTLFVPGQLLRVPHELAVIEIMIEQANLGRNYRQICDYLTAQGYRNRVDKVFQPMTVKRILDRTGRTRSRDQFHEPTKFHLFR